VIVYLSFSTYFFGKENRLKGIIFHASQLLKNKMQVEINGVKCGVVVAVAVQSVFHLEMHQNEVFLFLKNYF
jgi:hypothetical protein